MVPLAQIPARLAAIGQQIAPAAADRTMRPEGYNATDIQTIIALLQEKVGQDFSAYKRGTLERRIHRRMGLHPAPANKTIAVGEAITFEGPYGRFDFEPVRGAQLCIGGGVGITPFIARMETLTMSGHLADVDLIYSTAAPDDGFIAEVRNAAAASGVRLHLVDTGRDGFVDLEKIAGWIPEWRKADVWFCGPARFGDALHKAMRTEGLPTHRFHRELFQMR